MDLQPKLSERAIAELRDRWATPKGKEALVKLIRSLRDEPLDWKDDFVAPEAHSVPANYPKLMMDLRGVELRDLDLTNAQLPYVDLSYASVKDCELEDVCLQGSMLQWACFKRCNLARSDLLQVMADHSSFETCLMDDAVLGNGDFRASTFRDVQMFRAILDGADISEANLVRVDLGGAHMLFTKFPRGFDPKNAPRRSKKLGYDPSP